MRSQIASLLLLTCGALALPFTSPEGLLRRWDQDEAAYAAWPVEEHTMHMSASDQDEAAYAAWPVEEHNSQMSGSDQDEAAYAAWPSEVHEQKLPIDQDEAAYAAWPVEEHQDSDESQYELLRDRDNAT